MLFISIIVLIKKIMHKVQFLLFLLFLNFSTVFCQADTTLIMSYIKSAEKNYAVNLDLDLATVFAKKAINLSEKITFYKGLGYGYSALGIIDEYKGNYAESILNYESSKKHFTKGHITKGIATSNLNLGVGYYYLAEYEKSLTYYLNALKAFEKISFKKGIASVNNNIGSLYEEREDYSKALIYFKKSLVLKEELKIDASSTLQNIGINYCNQGDFEEGLVYYLKAKKVKESNGGVTATLYSNISACYIELKQFNKAFTSINKAIRLDTSINNNYGFAYELEVYGDLELAQNNKKIALKKYLKSYELSKNTYSDLEINITKKISDLYTGLAMYKKALEFNKALLLAKENVFFEKNKEAIANLEIVYETGKKTQKIKLLNTENSLLFKENKLKDVTIERNRIIRFGLIAGALLLLLILFLVYRQFKIKAKTNNLLAIKNAELKELNATKDKLFSIVAHDLKNPVFAFKTLTENMSKGFEKIPKEMMFTLISQLRNSSFQLFDVLNNLLSWSNSQRNN
ncbi:MAG: tetratricopeptide repeat protein, partial [Flavobacteriales bacterium]|nr:tetratricopeptide repeat protein [Flavobacteriales bacterium]